MAEYEKYEVIVTDLTKDPKAERVAGIFLIDSDERRKIFFDWYENEVPEQLNKKRGIEAKLSDGIYKVKHKRAKSTEWTIHLRSHTAITLKDKLRHTRIVKGKINIKLI